MRPELLVSDFAGTAMKEEGTVLNAYRVALNDYAIPFTEDDLAARRGASKRAVFRELSARTGRADHLEAADLALARFEGALREEYETGDVQPVDGAVDAFAALKASGIKLALSSGFERDIVDLLARRLGFDELFDVILSSTDTPLGRPAPYLIYRAMIDLSVQDVSRVAVVGDTPLDLQAGMNARAGWVIGVTSGAHGMATLGATHHTHLLASVAGLPRLFGIDA
ncbi:MAG: HAD hydrolase-like protein [Chloroflexota bacterium]